MDSAFGLLQAAALQIPRHQRTLGPAAFDPPPPAHVDGVIIAMGGGQISPRTAHAGTVENRLESLPVADLTFKAVMSPTLGKSTFDLRPLPVAQVQEPVFVVHDDNLTPPSWTSNVL